MKKYKIINLVTTIGLCLMSFVAVLIMTNNISQSIFSHKEKATIVTYTAQNSSNELNESIINYLLDFELENLTIKENEVYEITNFIPENGLILLSNIDYNYKDTDMGNYKTSGNYEIVIVFNYLYDQEIEKTTSLVIEKVEIAKTDSQVTHTQTENKLESINTVSNTQTDIESEILENDSVIGTYGRIYFSSLYSVALYAPTTSEEAQQIVDADDSAAIYKYGDIKIIADHVTQGFSIIKYQNVGDYIYIKKLSMDGNYTLERYVVKEKTNGKNTKYNLITDDNRDIGQDVDYPLALYTCNTDDGYYITILLLDRA